MSAHLRDAWAAVIAGPAAGVIPDRVKDRKPVNTHAPKPVVVDPMAKRDIERLYPDEVPKVWAAIELLEQGKAPIEPKHRDELVGTFGIRIDKDCRLLVFPHIDGAWHVFYVGHHDYEEAERRMSAPRARVAALPTGLFWRTHPNGRSFGPGGTSTTFYTHETREGYSCFANPWHLWTYLYATMMIGSVSDDEITAFSGTKVGQGNDGEDLAQPDMRLVQRMSFGAFERELVTTPFPPSPAFGPLAHAWTVVPTTSWKAIAASLANLEEEDIVSQHIIKIWG